jgi:hypothetical protein
MRRLLALGFAVLLFGGSVARADSLGVGEIRSPGEWEGKIEISLGTYRDTNGGEFEIDRLTGFNDGVNDTLLADPFTTFCAELTQYIGPPKTYWGYITPAADESDPDPELSAGASALYYDWWFGNLVSGYSQTEDTNASDALAGSIQRAIWRLEGFSEAQISGWGSDLQAQAWYTQYVSAPAKPGARELQLYEFYDRPNDQVEIKSLNQNQVTLIVFDPPVPPQEVVPLPSSATAGLVLLAGLGIAYVRRRHRS